ncbi:MAG: hypothetical protein HC945_04520, partial [Nitrosarchaeum sp.]|nr:hypothetical protein [Nitrosarchaeum sp.]
MKGKLRIKMGGYDRIANVNYAELFAFAFKEEMRGGYMRERLLNKSDTEWASLTDDQKKVLSFLNDKFSQWFVGPGSYLNETGGKLAGRPASWLELFNFGKSEDMQQKWYDGWFPKVIKTYEEVNYEEGARVLGKPVGKGDVAGANIVGKFSRNTIREKIKRRLTWYVDDTFEMFSDVKMSLPIKYMDNFKVMNEKNYTHNLEFMFDRFNKSMLHKKHMDEVYTTGQALKQFLLMKKEGNGQPMFENTVGFLEKKLILDIQNRIKKPKYSKTPITITRYWDPVEQKYHDYNLDLDKVIMGMNNWTSATIMWLRPLQGGGNGLHAKMLTYREGLKGTIASRFAHIDGDAIDFTVKDNAWADKTYFNSFLVDSMFGRLDQNKLWLLARKLNYLPDNYDYATNRRFLLSTRNQALDKSSMYMFHSKPEEYVSLTTMAAQMHHLKHPGNGKSLWDNYEVQQRDGIWDVHWVGGVRGYEKIGKGEASQLRPMTELNSHEIAKLKKVHERMQGGYRKEEAANLEIYVMGKSMIQFKKYLPRLIMNAVGSKKEVVDLGYYRKLAETRKDPNTGEQLPVYEWVRRLNEGRWRTLANFVLQSMKLAGPEYKWSNMSSEQKQNIIDAQLTLGMWALMTGVYLGLFYDEDDDDTFKKWWRNYLVLNLSQQYNPLDLLHTLESASRPVALARMYKLTESFTMMLVATGDLMFLRWERVLLPRKGISRMERLKKDLVPLFGQLGRLCFQDAATDPLQKSG